MRHAKLWFISIDFISVCFSRQNDALHLLFDEQQKLLNCIQVSEIRGALKSLLLVTLEDTFFVQDKTKNTGPIDQERSVYSTNNTNKKEGPSLQ